MTFYPGPSKLYPQVAQYLQDAYDSGILSANHRSPAFMDLVRETERLLHEKLAIPTDYYIYFVCSATECWEIIAQSLTRRESVHAYSGAFGEKWAEYAARLKPMVVRLPFDLENSVEDETVTTALRAFAQAEVICLTQNETSNGTQVPMSALKIIHETATALSVSRPLLLAIDATSSMAGVDFDWALGDVWFASVQKCFGLPAGLGLLVCSPRARHRAVEIGERGHYNSLLFIHENAAKAQTHYTPNGLGIYLLKRVLEHVPPIADVAERLRRQASDWYRFFDNHPTWKPLVSNPAVRSDTVIAIEGQPVDIKLIKEKCKAAGITLGNGYGAWKDRTFRIANFPAIEEEEIEKLKEVLNYASWD
ncbi:MAG: aminotransferase class V-fold PLP-dependent enzyme [Cytophagaceae bacterium]|nr:aminotransferase class V-fold PLP-dependent enzyme [Cytophagaceae bacterium]